MSLEHWVGVALFFAIPAMWLAVEIDLRIKRRRGVDVEARDDGWWWV